MLRALTCARFRLVLQAIEPLQLNAFAGATLRGGRGQYQPGERFDVGLVLIGRGIEYLPYFVFTFWAGSGKGSTWAGVFLTDPT